MVADSGVIIDDRWIDECGLLNSCALGLAERRDAVPSSNPQSTLYNPAINNPQSRIHNQRSAISPHQSSIIGVAIFLDGLKNGVLTTVAPTLCRTPSTVISMCSVLPSM